MAAPGVIAERVRGILPITWDALSKDSRYGDDLLKSVVETVKSLVFGKSVPTTAEAAQPVLVVDYTAKLAAIEICTAGIDFWMNEPISESATGTNETHVFSDRAAALKEQRDLLLAETRRLEPIIADLIGYRAFSPRRPLSSTINAEFLTPSPQEFPRPFARTTYS